ncbi:hypothetical protein BDP27DRAFT_566780 [Rhodocollybia butyracea]|uniref:Uncharacterized protein n=1 Tax=Rhodocollybia butyracea TaxID=206335 RepID=A0A9P5PRC3_9AGAR|nr:hypothetical protein BDP27DRAFT_566780 [Rhodocollybia butyracea]
MALSGRSNVDFVLDLVRQQGEELLRARKELEHSQASNKIIYKIQNQLANFQNTSAQWQIRLSKIQEAFTDLMVENESMNLELQATRSTLEAALELRASIPSYMTNCSGTEHPMTQSTEDSDKASKISFDPSHMSSTSGKPGEGGPMPSGDREDSFAETVSKEQTSLTVITDTPKEVTDVATTTANSIIGTARPEIPVPLEKPSPTHHAIAESSIGQNENQATSPTSQTNKNGDEPQQLSITGFKPLCSRLPVPKAGKAVQELFQADLKCPCIIF